MRTSRPCYRHRRRRAGRAAASASVALILSAFGSIGLTAQSTETGRVLGRVLEKSTGEPVSQAEVAVDGGPSTLTDLNGRFMLAAVPAGTVDITVQALGYASKTVTGVAAPTGELTTLDITVESQAIALEGIRVSAERDRAPVPEGAAAGAQRVRRGAAAARARGARGGGGALRRVHPLPSLPDVGPANSNRPNHRTVRL